jgi:hypothetical protein
MATLSQFSATIPRSWVIRIAVRQLHPQHHIYLGAIEMNGFAELADIVPGGRLVCVEARHTQGVRATHRMLGLHIPFIQMNVSRTRPGQVSIEGNVSIVGRILIAHQEVDRGHREANSVLQNRSIDHQWFKNMLILFSHNITSPYTDFRQVVYFLDAFI